MTISKTLFLGLAAVSLCACSTTSVVPSPSDTLLAGIDTSAVTQPGFTKILSASDPTCLSFYKNTTAFVSLPAADLNIGGAPKGPSFGSTLTKTLILGTLSGVVSGGVAAIGIGNSFAEAALIGTASQVTYNVGGTVYDSIVAPTPVAEVPEVPDVPALSPLQEIEKAAATLGCPAPDQAAIAALKLSDK